LESVFIEGHTDNQLIAGLRDGNWLLSYSRARAVYRELTQNSPQIEELKNDKNGSQGTGEKLLGISGYADQRPAASNDTPAGQQANRRIDLRFIMAIPDPERQSQIDEIITKAPER
jgi:flagellar motor protein MotB